MQQKMLSFLVSIGAPEPERFDMDFLLAARDQYNRAQINMAIEKQTPWDYDLLEEFLALCAENIHYPYSIRFSYACEITPDIVSSLLLSWYFSHYHVFPSFQLSSSREGVLLAAFSSQTELEANSNRIKDFQELLRYINYPYLVESSFVPQEPKEEAPVKEEAPLLEETPIIKEDPLPESMVALTAEKAEEAVEETSFESEPAEEELNPIEEGKKLIAAEQKATQEAGEKELMEVLEKNYQRMMEERNRKRVWTTGDYRPVDNIEAIYKLGLGNVDFCGEIYEATAKLSRKGTMVGTYGIGDETNAIALRAFEGKRLSAATLSGVKPHSRYRIRGAIDTDKFSGQRMIVVHFMDQLPPKEPRRDDAEVKRVELHLHTNMSTMDAIPEMADYVKAAYDMGMKALAVTDHGVAQSFPIAQDTAKKYQKKYGYLLKMIYGSELNVFNDQPQFIMNPSSRPLRTARYCVFDTETTGLSARYDRIIEFGGVIIEGGNVVKRWDTFIKPDIDLSAAKEAMAINRITEADLRSAPTMDEVLPKILEFFGDCIIVAHNATFDIGFVDSALERAGLPPISNPIIDTLPLSHYLFPFAGRHSQGTMLNNLGLKVYNEKEAHRADYDADALSVGWLEILARLEKETPGLVHADLQSLSHPRGDASKIGDPNDPEDPGLIEFKEKEAKFNAYCKHIRAYHATVLAKNQVGLRDLFRIISESHTTYLAGTSNPKTPRSLLEKYRANLLIGSACLNGEIFELARTRNLDALIEGMKFFDFIEIQPIENYSYLLNMGYIHSKDHLIEILKDIIKAAHLAGKPVVATGDVHYLNPEDHILRDVYIYATAIGGGAHPLNPPSRKNKPFFENPPQHFRTTKEMLDSFSAWLSEEEAYEYVVTNSNLIADQCSEDIVVVTDDLRAPDANLPNSAEKLRALCYGNFEKNYNYDFDDDPEVKKAVQFVKERLDRELDGIIGHGYAVTYYIAHKLIHLANNEPERYIVGSRGSVGSSFAATMAEITEVNALPAHYHCPKCHYLRFEDSKVFKSGFDLPNINCPKCGTPIRGEGQNIPFETFLGFAADKVPDIDLNFEEESQHKAHNYTKILLGEKNVFRAGTIETVAQKTAFGYVRGYFEKTGHNLDEMNPNYIAYIASRCEGVKRTTGQHPGGIVVVPAELEVFDFTPIQHPADDFNSEWLTTHFDFRSMHDEILKFDILGHVDPMAMRYYRDLSHVAIEDIPMNDPKVLSLFTSPTELKLHRNYLNSKTGASGLPEFGTNMGQQMLEETQPRTFNDLLIISGLSHGTDVYSGNAQDLIMKEGKTLNDVIGCRDDIMTFLISKGVVPQHAFKIMEGVRKGKGLTEEQENEMRACNVPDYYIASCKKIKYLFPRGHATAYVMMAVRVAFFKLYYPLQFYAVFFSIRSDDWDIKTMIDGEDAIIAKIEALKLRRNDRSNPLSPKEENILKTLLIALEMCERGYKFANIDLYRSDYKMFVVDEENKALIPPFSVIDGLGENAAKSLVDARNEVGMDGKPKKFLSKEDVLRRASKLNGTNLARLEELGVLEGLGETNQMSLFDF